MRPRPIHLREASEADIPAIASVIRRAFAEYEHTLTPPSGAQRETAESIGDKLRAGGAFVALLGEVVVGCVLFEPEEAHLYLGRLAVLPDYRRSGIAHRLVAAVEDRARSLGLPTVQLGVRVALPQNSAFFERLGYHVVSHGSHAGYAEPTYLILEKPVA